MAIKEQTCPICGGTKSHPWRVYDERGKVIEGCVDEFHTGEIISPSESSFWHGRKEAKQIRKQNKILSTAETGKF